MLTLFNKLVKRPVQDHQLKEVIVHSSDHNEHLVINIGYLPSVFYKNKKTQGFNKYTDKNGIHGHDTSCV